MEGMTGALSTSASAPGSSLCRGGRVRAVIVVDISPVMLEILRANVAVIGLVNVQVVQSGFRT